MKYYLSIVAIFKNESRILGEWLNHYLMEGVEHFYLIDNDSSDQYREILQPYVRENKVEYVSDSRSHMQMIHYNSYYKNIIKAESEWVIVADLDEFIYSRLQFKTISNYLRSLDHTVAQIYIPWKLFGSNGLLEQPMTCLNGFTRRTQYQGLQTNGMRSSDRMLTKTIVRTQYLTQLDIHSSNITMTSEIQQITSDGQPIIDNEPCYQSINERILSQSALHNNHYPIQSYEWFRQIKMTRGSAAIARNDKVRTITYYNSFDSHSNQVIDTELADKRGNFRAYYGAGKYWDVTWLVYHHFSTPNPSSKQIQIVINKTVDFNHFFGDPALNQVKSFVIHCNHQLIVYPEQHETITFTVTNPL